MKTNKTINFGKYLMIGFIGLSVALAACDEKVPQKKTEEPDEKTPVNTIATKEVKDAVLRDNSYIRNSAYSAIKNDVIILYEQFDYMICIGYCEGAIYILPYQRPNGNWTIYSHGTCNTLEPGDYYCRTGDRFFFGDLGKINGLSDITVKNPLPGASRACARLYTITEKGGYEIAHKVDNETQYIRLWIKSYSEDSNGMIQSITVQYQLF